MSRNSALAFLLCLPVCAAAGDQQSAEAINGFPLLVEAIRHSGRSDDVIQTGRLILTETIRKQPLNARDYDERYENYLTMLREQRDIFEQLGHDENKRSVEEAIHNAPEGFSKMERSLNNQTHNICMTFEGVDPCKRVATRYTTIRDGVPDRYVVLRGTLGRRTAGESKDYIRHRPDSNPRDITIQNSTIVIPPVYEFGRFRGRSAVMLHAFLLDESRLSEPTLDEAKIATDNRLNLDVIKVSDGKNGIRIVGEEVIEGSLCIIFETDDPNASWARGWLSRLKVWVDPARGFITPRIIEYLDGTPNVEYVSSDYELLGDSGLWWPQSHIIREYNGNQEPSTVTEYQMDLSGSCLNCPVADKDFSIPVLKGFHVTDSRSWRAVTYIMEKDFDMQFNSSGQLNFDRAKNVAINEESIATIDSLGAIDINYRFILLLAINILIVGAVLAVVIYRIRKKLNRS